MTAVAVMWIIGLVVSVLVPAFAGLLNWTAAIAKKQSALELKMAEDYTKVSEIREVKTEIRELRDEFKQDLAIVYRLVAQVAQRLEIPVAVEPYRL